MATKTARMTSLKLVKPGARRSLWRVEGYVGRTLVGTWRCDSEEIAREVLRRLRKGRAPGWVAHDLRHPKR